MFTHSTAFKHFTEKQHHLIKYTYSMFSAIFHKISPYTLTAVTVTLACHGPVFIPKLGSFTLVVLVHVQYARYLALYCIAKCKSTHQSRVQGQVKGQIKQHTLFQGCAPNASRTLCGGVALNKTGLL